MKFSGAVYRPLAARQTQPKMIRHDIICLHTMVGFLSSTDDMFHKNGWGGTESHFGVGGKWGPDKAKGWDGKIFQWQDTAYTADANFQGNPRVISIETADNAPKFVEDIEPLTDRQIDSIVDIMVWACTTYDIPPALVPDSKPGRRGIAYHRQGCEHSDGLGSHEGWLVPGGERWSTSLGKGCPSPARIKQLKTIIIPRVQARLNGDDMSAEDVRQIKDAIPTTAEIAKALKPVIAAEVAAQLKAWQNQPVDLGAFAGGALPKPDGTPSTQHTAGNLLEYSAAHAAEANRNTQAILKRLPDVPADPTN